MVVIYSLRLFHSRWTVTFSLEGNSFTRTWLRFPVFASPLPFLIQTEIELVLRTEHTLPGVSPRPSWGCRQSWSRCFGKEGNGEHYNVPRMAARTEKLISLLEQFSIKTKANGAGVACWEKNRKEDKPKQINIYQGDCLNAYIRQFLIFESPVRSMGFSEARDLYCVHLLVSK